MPKRCAACRKREPFPESCAYCSRVFCIACYAPRDHKCANAEKHREALRAELGKRLDAQKCPKDKMKDRI